MKKVSLEEFKKRLFNAHGDDMILVGEFKNMKTKTKFRHKCGYEWETVPYSIVRGIGCPSCSGNARWNTEIIKQKFYELVGNEYSIMDEYITTHTPIEIKHNECGNIFKMSPRSFMNGQRCPNERYKRSAKNNSYTLEQVKNKIKELVGEEYHIIGEYTKSTSDVEFIHNKCGSIFSTSPTRFIKRGVRCKTCTNTSKGELIVEEYLKDNKYNYEAQYKIADCKNIKPLPFDFAVFNKDNTLKCLIEYDGEQHFKPKFSLETFEKTIINDSIKNNYCSNNKIHLIRIKYKNTTSLDVLKKYIYNCLDDEIK